MHKVDQIVSNVIYQTINGGLDWKLLSKNNKLTIYISKKKISKDKYISLYLNIYFFGGKLPIDDILLRIEMTTNKDTISITKMLSEFYPRVIDIYDLMGYEY